MFAGHLGVAMLFKRADPKINLGALFLAVLLLDVLLWTFILLGIEAASAPFDFQSRHYMTFFFPYSHGLLTSFLWALLAGFVGYVLWQGPAASQRNTALVLSLAVFSHFILDYLVHIPELPVAGPDSYRLGLGLWNHLPWALGLEASLAVLGTILWWRSTTLNFTRKSLLVLLMVLVTGMTVAGQWLQTSPPKPHAMAIASLVTIFLLCLAGAGLDRKPMPQ
ncbi:MAG: hypothetical protein U0V70_19880 [Terriglobia bacterium]